MVTHDFMCCVFFQIKCKVLGRSDACFYISTNKIIGGLLQRIQNYIYATKRDYFLYGPIVKNYLIYKIYSMFANIQRQNPQKCEITASNNANKVNCIEQTHIQHISSYTSGFI